MLERFSRVVVLVFLAVLTVNVSFAQDAQFTQFYANPAYLNPAFAGVERCPRVILNYRDQWPGLSGNFITTTVSFDKYVSALTGGVGIQFMNDRAGENTLQTNRIALQYSKSFNISRNFAIRFGGEAAFVQRSLDWSKLTFNDQIDTRKGFIKPTLDNKRGGAARVMDFSGGILGYSDVIYFGVAVHHLFQPNESVILGESRLPRKYTAHAGAKIRISDFKYSSNSSSYVSPNILYQQQADFQQLLVGVYMSYGPILGGAWYRNKDSFILLAGVQTGKLKFGYSYDVTVNKLTTRTGGSHEISISLGFDCRPPKRKFRTISCPTF